MADGLSWPGGAAGEEESGCKVCGRCEGFGGCCCCGKWEGEAEERCDGWEWEGVESEGLRGSTTTFFAPDAFLRGCSWGLSIVVYFSALLGVFSSDACDGASVEGSGIMCAHACDRIALGWEWERYSIGNVEQSDCI